MSSMVAVRKPVPDPLSLNYLTAGLPRFEPGCGPQMRCLKCGETFFDRPASWDAYPRPICCPFCGSGWVEGVDNR